jgi:hypothetical protein
MVVKARFVEEFVARLAAYLTGHGRVRMWCWDLAVYADLAPHCAVFDDHSLEMDLTPENVKALCRVVRRVGGFGRNAHWFGVESEGILWQKPWTASSTVVPSIRR